ncbi:MAG: hypothetical protein HFI63_04095 [Lachnospiraceae bacterium]|nr:hypothetical protein [Lachnospiraceae bacterium]
MSNRLEQNTEDTREERIVQEIQGEDYDSLSEAPEQIVSGEKTYRLTDTDYEEVYREEEQEQTIREEMVLSSEDTSSLPRTLIRDGVEYLLDEDSLSLRVSRTELRRDLDILEEYVTYMVEDNDIEELQKEIVRDGTPLELIEVEYRVAETTESGIPSAYEAVCRYAVNVEQENEIPVEWTATAVYTGTKRESVLDHVIAKNTYEQILEPEILEESVSVKEEEQREGLETEGEMETATIEEAGVPLGAALEEEVSLDATLERPLNEAVFLNHTVAGAAGGLILGGAFACCLFVRRKNRVSIHMGGQRGEVGQLLGKTCARVEKGLLVVRIPERLMELPGVRLKKLVLKPSGQLLRGRIRQMKIVSSAGVLFAGLKDTVVLWEDGISGLDERKTTEGLA